MLFRSRRNEPASDNPRVTDVSDAGTDETMLRDAQPLVEWRRSAQQVTRAWNAWLTAETRDRAERYRAFVAALAIEEHAAVELERSIDPTEAGKCTSTTDGQKSGLGAG